MDATPMMTRPCKELAPLPSALLVLSAVCSAGRVESLVLQGRFIIAVAYIHRAYVYAYVYVSDEIRDR
jgi:hypothetical protein